MDGVAGGGFPGQSAYGMDLTCIIFSDLPGTGKTTLVRLLARELHLPQIQLDAVVDITPPHMLRHAEPFWDDVMQIVMHLAATQLPTASA